MRIMVQSISGKSLCMILYQPCIIRDNDEPNATFSKKTGMFWLVSTVIRPIYQKCLERFKISAFNQVNRSALYIL